MDLPVIQLPDVQSDLPEIPINLTRVGVTGVKKLVEVARANKRPIILISIFDIFVDLPNTLKGANLSRNFEAIDEVLEKAISSPIYEIEELCGEVARKLLDRHEYASKAEVSMK
ncbi:MAG: GTP cyclohydrolase, FolE2/MptA family, partial [Methanosarcinales archaeon]